jgi:hypothetical protein
MVLKLKIANICDFQQSWSTRKKCYFSNQLKVFQKVLATVRVLVGSAVVDGSN